jgi:hypothetical protein
MKKRYIILLIIISLAVLACSIFVGGPAYPDTPIPVSTEAEQSLQGNIQKAISDSAQTGTIALQITESQLTSYLASKLDSQTDPVISEPQVLLRQGQMIIYGKVQSGIFSANVSITTKVSVDENGLPKIDITQTDFGPLPAPQGVNDAISAFVREAFTGSFGPVAIGFRLDTISISEGVMLVTAHVR